MRKVLSTVCFSLLTPLLLECQIGTGTILIFQLQKDKFIMGADSRMLLNGISSDGNCKIAAFQKSQVVFGVTNAPKYIPLRADLAPAWDAMTEVGKLLASEKGDHDAPATVNAIADAWANNMQLNWQFLYRLHPELVRKAALDEKQGLTHGIFAMASKGQIALAARGIQFENNAVTIEKPEFIKYCGAPEMCASGRLDIFMEYMKKTSERAKDEKWEFPESSRRETSLEMLKIVKLINLTIAHDESGTVGGPIDAVELDADGKIHWYLNPNCPGSYE